MAIFEVELPDEIMKDIKSIYDNYEHIFGEMTKAGAEVVYHNVVSHVPDEIKNSAMMNNLRLSRTYKTPTDDGINTKVLFSGYFINHEGVKTPAPLVANLFEYGRSNSPFPKKPFLRKSFSRSEIEKAMLNAQRKLTGGLLE